MPDVEDTHHVTQLLGEIAEGKESAREALVTAIYGQLRSIAQGRMNAERTGHTLQATALVNEAYLKLEPSLGKDFITNRRELYAAAAAAMRRILIDHARSRGRLKRGAGVDHDELQEEMIISTKADEQVLAVDAAMDGLEREEPQAARVVQLRYFGGFAVPEVAEAMGVSERTVHRLWRFARSWLRAEISRDLAE